MVGWENGGFCFKVTLFSIISEVVIAEVARRAIVRGSCRKLVIHKAILGEPSQVMPWYSRTINPKLALTFRRKRSTRADLGGSISVKKMTPVNGVELTRDTHQVFRHSMCKQISKHATTPFIVHIAS